MRFVYIISLLIGVALQQEAVSAQEIEGSVPILVKEEGLFEAGGFCKCIHYLTKKDSDPEVITSILIQTQNIGNEQDRDAIYRAYLNNPHIDSERVLIILEEFYGMKPEKAGYKADFWESFFRPSFLWLRQRKLTDLSPKAVVEKAVKRRRNVAERNALLVGCGMHFLNSDSQFEIERFAKHFGIEDGF